MPIQSENAVKRKLVRDGDAESSNKLDKSIHLLHFCDEFADDETDESDEADGADEENRNERKKYLESLKNEIRQWKKLLDESKAPPTFSNNFCENISSEYEKILTDEQLQYIRSAVDYNKWLTESNEFRKKFTYFMSKRKLCSMLNTDFEKDVMARIEAVATSEYVDNFALNCIPL